MTSTTPAPTATSLRGRTQRMAGLRKIIAQRMVESLRNSAQLTSVVEVDLTGIAELRNRTKADFESREGVKLSFLPFLAKAALEALRNTRRSTPRSTRRHEITYHDAEHLGVAVDTEKGLYVPVIRDAGDMNIAELGPADRRRRRTDPQRQDQAGRDGRRHLHDHQHRQPRRPVRHPDHQPAPGRDPRHRRGRPASRGRPYRGRAEKIDIRSMAYLALSYDHRLVDGADAARYLSTMKTRLEAADFAAEVGG